MEWINRYVYQVGQQLPAKSRDDVREELRSLLLDSLQERAAAADRPPDKAMELELLREFGPPDEVARRYQGEGQYLISPRSFHTYRKVLVIVLVVASALVLLGKLVTGRLEWSILGGVVQFLLLNFGAVTLIFAILERVDAGKTSSQSWDPAKLEPVPDREALQPAAHVLALYAILAFAYMFNFRPDWVGVLFTEQVFLLAPIINVWWGAAFVLNFWVLRQGRWSQETRWFELGLGIAGLALTYLVLTSGWFTSLGSFTARPALLIGMVIGSIEAVVRAIRVIQRSI